MSKKIVSTVLVTLLISLTFFSSFTFAQDKTEAEKIEVVEKIELSNGKSIEKLSDGRVAPVAFTNTMQKGDINRILKEMGFKMQEIADMSDELKKDIIANGGKKVETTSNKASYTFYNGGIEYTVEGKNIAETKVKAENIKEEILNEEEENTFSILTTGWQDTWDGIDESEGIWSAQTYVIYQGLTGTGLERIYKIYLEFDWSQMPFFQTNDSWGIGWDEMATEVANEDWAYVYNYQYPNYNYYTVNKDDSSLEGTDWKFYRYFDYPLSNTDHGYSYETVVIPTSKDGHLFTYLGAYAHPYTDFDISINFNPISFGFPTGDKWYWEESFTVGY